MKSKNLFYSIFLLALAFMHSNGQAIELKQGDSFIYDCEGGGMPRFRVRVLDVVGDKVYFVSSSDAGPMVIKKDRRYALVANQFLELFQNRRLVNQVLISGNIQEFNFTAIGKTFTGEFEEKRTDSKIPKKVEIKLIVQDKKMHQFKDGKTEEVYVVSTILKKAFSPPLTRVSYFSKFSAQEVRYFYESGNKKVTCEQFRN
jgi:hypothetical protein